MHQMEARLAEKDSMIDVLKKQQQQHMSSSVDSSVRPQAYDRPNAFHPIKLNRYCFTLIQHSILLFALKFHLNNQNISLDIYEE